MTARDPEVPDDSQEDGGEAGPHEAGPAGPPLGGAEPSDSLQQEMEEHLLSLANQLPEVPLPGPDKPQALAAKNKVPDAKAPAMEKAMLGDGENAPPVPTPCRTGTPTPRVEATPKPTLKSLVAHEERVLEQICLECFGWSQTIVSKQMPT